MIVGRRRAGTATQVADELLVTAAPVLCGAGSVRVRFRLGINELGRPHPAISDPARSKARGRGRRPTPVRPPPLKPPGQQVRHDQLPLKPEMAGLEVSR
jgi:hypothetical protein